MRHSRNLQRAMAGIILVAFCLFNVIVAPAQAALVSTATLLQTQDNDLARQKVSEFLTRHDVARHLQTWGVAPDEAQARVDAMTDQEVNILAAKIDLVPAGGDALGIVLLVSIVAFITLVITDIIGVTDVFTFIKKR